MDNNKFSINGTILCKCGGTIISYTGKVFYNYKTQTLKCWNCKKEYDTDFAFSKREENKIVNLES